MGNGSAPASPSAQSDEDIYEDADDLDFAGTTQGLYLTRIPKFLWETWSKLKDADEIRIGTIRVEGSSEDPKRICLLLSSDSVQNKRVPKEYNMHATSQDSSNTFIFTEKDLPGYASRMKGSARKSQNNGGFSSGRISGRPAFRDRSRQGLQQGDKSKSGSLVFAGRFQKPDRNVRGKPQDARAARIPQNELLDLIYDCFKLYNYWSLKSLKAELNQPEAYLKQTLEKVAHLVRKGTHAMTWQLKPASKIGAYADARLYEQVKDEVAPDIGFDGASDYKDFGELIPSDEDDETVKMEDALPV
ncbi:hypothetical protein MMC22_007643 [Lobaria immixta]|nr:hypothetical protein [Lobaria immixta]